MEKIISKKQQEFIEKARQIHGNRYDYSLVVYNKIKEKIKIICKDHGIFEQRPINHLQGSGCSKCGIIKGTTKNKLTKQEFIEKARQIHRDKYDYSLLEYNGYRNKEKIICKKHGVFIQKLGNHAQGKGCLKCSLEESSINQRSNIKSFIEKAKQIHGDKYDYSLVEYINNITNVKITCKEHGIFEQLPSNHLSKKCGCEKCSFIITKPHEKLLNFLKELNLEENKDFIINDREIIKPLELDIYLPKHKLAIEINGAFWHSTNDFDVLDIYKYRHLEKLKASIGKKLHLLQFTDIEIENKFDLVKSMISQKLGLSEKIYARKMIIKELTNEEVKEFLNNNHMQGYIQASINICLMDSKNNIIQLMSFGKPRYISSKYNWELIRLCTKQNFTVIGGSERLFNHFKENHFKEKESILSYCDRRFFNGNIYKKLGFEFIENTSPNYIYLDKKGRYIGSRYKFQKKKLANFISNFDENKTEIQNMLNNENRILFDCGNKKFLYNL